MPLERSARIVGLGYDYGAAVRGPGYATFDVALSKDMRTARGSVKVALQIFNVFNRANFDQPGSFADEPTTFGRILSAKAPRQAQLVARIGF